VTRLELVGGRENLDFVLDAFSRLHRLDGIPRKLVERSMFYYFTILYCCKV
jgi:hypothetical protein